GKSKGACTGLGSINAAAFNIRPSVRDRDGDGVTILLVGDLTLEPKDSDLCAAVIALSLRARPLAVLVPGCDELPTAYTDARQSSARTGISSKQSTSAAINRRISVIPNLLRSTRPAKIRGIAPKCCCKTPFI